MKVRPIMAWVKNLALFAAAAYLLIHFVVQRVDVYGSSMAPALESGDVLLVEKLTPRLGRLKRFDVIVFSYRYRKNQYYTKRIIALPGETIQIVDGNILIDGQILLEDFGTEPIEKGKRASEPVTLGENEYFVLGDNRNHSSDSRDWDIGNLKREEILGRVFFRIWPLFKAGMMKE